jgi:hypothetical protein
MKSVFRPQNLALSSLIVGFVFMHSSASLAGTTITPKTSVQGHGIAIALSVIANFLTDFLKSALGRNDITPETALSIQDFQNANVKTAFFLRTVADGATDVISFSSSSANAEQPQISAISEGKCTGANRTKIEIGGIIDRGFFGKIAMGEPLDAKACNTAGTFEVDTSYASGYGFLFANGEFITAGREKTGIIRSNVPVPAPIPLLGISVAFGYSRKLRNLSKKLKHSYS